MINPRWQAHLDGDADENVRIQLDPTAGTNTTDELYSSVFHGGSPWPISGDEITIWKHRTTYGGRWPAYEREAYLQGSTVRGVIEP